MYPTAAAQLPPSPLGPAVAVDAGEFPTTGPFPPRPAPRPHAPAICWGAPSPRPLPLPLVLLVRGELRRDCPADSSPGLGEEAFLLAVFLAFLDPASAAAKVAAAAAAAGAASRHEGSPLDSCDRGAPGAAARRPCPLSFLVKGVEDGASGG